LEDKQKHIARVVYAYKTAILSFRLFPEIWFDFASYLASVGRIEEGMNQLKAGLEANPTSLLLSFTLAEFEESRKVEFSTIQNIFETLLAKLEEKYHDTNTYYDRESKSMFEELKRSIPSDNIDETEWDGERREREREIKREHEKEVEQVVEVKRKKILEDIKISISLSWIIYMRFTRRSQVYKFNIRISKQHVSCLAKLESHL
jgi:cleavage stimulation factor subunit 3